jgi:hypothetical protein
VQRREFPSLFEAAERLAGSAVLVQDAFDENVSVTVPILAWREFWDAVDAAIQEHARG